ncbi:MAG TPA: tetratricopeptide repeat protein [Candidatus Sulfotelmatobacter sp.]|nr:tetratricopeptide repeat protein [Candidatus Sulfotelmatobacter sp.]
MPVWGKTQSGQTRAIPARGFRNITLVVGVVSVLTALSAGQLPTHAEQQTPDEHLPPNISEIERMERNNPRNPAGNPQADSADETCLLPPLTLTSSPSVSTVQLQASAAARWEYHRACAALGKKKYAEAEKHLRKAVIQSPKYAAAWVTLGQVLDREQRADEARRACLQGSAVESSYIPAYLCLADIAARDSAWDEVLKLTTRTTELDPAGNAVAHEYHAAALLHLHQLAEAERSGLRAVEIDKENREPRAHFVLAQIYEAKGDAEREAVQLREFLKHAQDANDIAVAQQALAKVEEQIAGKDDAPQVRMVIDAARAPAERWAPADIDEWIPPVLSTACPLEKILEETSHRSEDMIENLQRFSASERIALTDTDKNGKKHSSSERDGNYVVEITQASRGYPHMHEFRTGPSEGQPAVLDSGIAGFALIFHPSHVANFDFHCEGRTEMRGLPAWQIHFEEKADPGNAFMGVRSGGTLFLPRLKGRAWIASDSSEVLRIETDLMSPIPQINLELEHQIIDYGPVEFPKKQVRLWLPESTDIYLAYHGHRYERTHKFSQFQLFSVDAVESVQGKPSEKFQFMP